MIADTIEFCLWYEQDIRLAILDAKNSAGRGGVTGGNGTGHMRVSDPTAVQALRAVQKLNVLDVPYGTAIGINKRWQNTYRLRNPAKWLLVVAFMKRRYLLDTENPLHDFFERRYIKKEDWQKTCKDLQIKRSRYFVMRAEVIRAGEVYAAGCGAASMENILK
ncbi:hypothetical protein SAMN04487864_11545 [Succiniclasticum ruminis]|uniref:Uncharacterized protein n=1 Tax=Succiniclasticum ruminis TaxID=40841 RepID=A0A1G6NQG1_9FIRM|nr:hypothetical protein [Succiniclasticum ruminis]SDC69989.1 hypothetical protein SAMN04487864_11545 [Succiniclasticum ruminis]